MTKHAVVALSESLYDGLRARDSKLHCSVLCPGVINTQIMYGARNRPAELLNNAPTTAMEQESRDRIKRLAETSGMSPEDTAGVVLQAIRDEQFWI